MEEQEITLEQLKDLTTNGILPPKQQYYFSLFSGQIYCQDEDQDVDAFQIPLTGKLPEHKNCNKCYGRLYTAFNVTNKHYEPCRKCLKKYLDVKKLAAINLKKREVAAPAVPQLS
jgi:hypothetical protein